MHDGGHFNLAATRAVADLAASPVSENVPSDAAEASSHNEHQQWCASPYRSCDPARDTYCSYSGQSGPVCLHLQARPWCLRAQWAWVL